MYCLYLKYYKQSQDPRIKYQIGSWSLSFHRDVTEVNRRIEHVRNSDCCLDANSAVIKSLECPYPYHDGECEAWAKKRYRLKPNGSEIDCDICMNLRNFTDAFPRTPESPTMGQMILPIFIAGQMDVKPYVNVEAFDDHGDILRHILENML